MVGGAREAFDIVRRQQHITLVWPAYCVAGCLQERERRVPLLAHKPQLCSYYATPLSSGGSGWFGCVLSRLCSLVYGVRVERDLASTNTTPPHCPHPLPPTPTGTDPCTIIPVTTVITAITATTVITVDSRMLVHRSPSRAQACEYPLHVPRPERFRCQISHERVPGDGVLHDVHQRHQGTRLHGVVCRMFGEVVVCVARCCMCGRVSCVWRGRKLLKSNMLYTTRVCVLGTD